jgi:hypothetical protein
VRSVLQTFATEIAIVVICDLFSDSESLPVLHVRVAAARCPACVALPSCGFCQMTLQCVAGDVSGPTEGLSCSSWSFTNESCPGLIIMLYVSILMIF